MNTRRNMELEGVSNDENRVPLTFGKFLAVLFSQF
jgi:hypothetical protein